MHASPSEWLFFRELPVEKRGAQRLDAFALDALPKLSHEPCLLRSENDGCDFLSELKRPLKRRIGARYQNEVYFVTPAALVNAVEIPTDCGGRIRDVRAMETSDQPSCRLLQL
jgi:hypothetical protein